MCRSTLVGVLLATAAVALSGERGNGHGRVARSCDGLSWES